MPLDVPIAVFAEVLTHPACPMDPKKNYNYKKDDSESRKFPKYFVEKRKIENGQFAAPDYPDDPDDPDDPKPGPSNQRMSGASKTNPARGQKYRFTATRVPLSEIKNLLSLETSKLTIATIDCQTSRIDRFLYGKQWEKQWKNCGIETRLFTLCFYDGDVNSRPMALDLNDVFSHYGKWTPKSGGNVQEIIKAHDQFNVRLNVESSCSNVIEVHVTRTSTYAHAADKLKHAVRAADLAGYGMMIWFTVPEGEPLLAQKGSTHKKGSGVNTPGCQPRWEDGPTDHINAKQEAAFLEFYKTTNDFGMWYFCLPGALDFSLH